MEKIRREHCPKCKGTTLENILVVSEGGPIKIYVRCFKCKTFTARYTLERYLSDKTYESYLNNINPVRLSGKNIKEEIDFISQDVEQEFVRITENLDCQEIKDKNIEDIIIEAE